ncbi:hypothetical protein Sango_2303300 [Sesamum angolense]|uniref:Serine/threonine-protein phosphatase 7 long form-like protein n=1 Tax=Sesamum angolense TaxID=2727404 RepID=A0AAE1WAC4_9LAMI|nr:hypothetical protein Sango_2303300 [Sesamum angolense]
MHHPERVFRQFGMVQDIPPNPLISERRLHTIDRRGRHGEDWATFHRDYIVKWNDVQSMLVVRPEIVNGRGTVPDYMNWYYQITRVQISHNIGSIDITGYRPTDTRDWEYVIVINLEMISVTKRELALESCNWTLHDDFFECKISECAWRSAGDEAGPSNVYTPSGPSNVYSRLVHQMSTMRLVHQMSTMSWSIHFFTPAGPSYVYTSNMPFVSEDYAHNIHPLVHLTSAI